MIPRGHTCVGVCGSTVVGCDVWVRTHSKQQTRTLMHFTCVSLSHRSPSFLSITLWLEGRSDTSILERVKKATPEGKISLKVQMEAHLGGSCLFVCLHPPPPPPPPPKGVVTDASPQSVAPSSQEVAAQQQQIQVDGTNDHVTAYSYQSK